MHSSATFKKLSGEDKKEGKEPAKSDKNKKFELKRNLSCSYCKKKGHTLQNCYLKDKPCYICKGNHLMSKCPQYEEKKGMCYICDSKDHKVKDCTKKGGGKYRPPTEGSGSRVAHESGMTYTMWREWEESKKDEKEFDLMIEKGGVGEEKEEGGIMAVMAEGESSSFSSFSSPVLREKTGAEQDDNSQNPRSFLEEGGGNDNPGGVNSSTSEVSSPCSFLEEGGGIDDPGGVSSSGCVDSSSSSKEKEDSVPKKLGKNARKRKKRANLAEKNSSSSSSESVLEDNFHMHFMLEKMVEGGVKGEELEWFGTEGEVLFGENSDGVMSDEVRNSWLIHLEKTKKKKKKKERANSSMVESRDGSSSSLPSARMKFPVTLGGLEIMAHFNSCTDFFILREDLWEKMKGEKVKHRIRFRGVGGMRLQEDYGKKVLLETPDCSFKVVVHP